MRKLVLVTLILALFLAACTATMMVRDIKQESMIGKRVAVQGVVQASLKIGPVSGYIIRDANGDTIPVSTLNLPPDNVLITARGVLMRDTLLGYYIKS